MPIVESPPGLNVLIVVDQTASEVPDAPEVHEPIGDGLDQLGWRAWRLSPSEMSRGAVTNRPPDAVLVGRLEPLGSVVDVVQAIAGEAPGVPVLVLTDDLSLAEQVLFAGATAVLPEQARTALVHAQLRAVLRAGQGTRQPSDATGVIRVRQVRVDALQHQVTANNRPLDLTPTEYRILTTLVRHAGRALSADFLLQQCSGVDMNHANAQGIVKVHIARLRRKLSEATGERNYIRNVRNVGYLLERRRRGAPRE